jgi:hypothetical protein
MAVLVQLVYRQTTHRKAKPEPAIAAEPPRRNVDDRLSEAGWGP